MDDVCPSGRFPKSFHFHGELELLMHCKAFFDQVAFGWCHLYGQEPINKNEFDNLNTRYLVSDTSRGHWTQSRLSQTRTFHDPFHSESCRQSIDSWSRKQLQAFARDEGKFESRRRLRTTRSWLCFITSSFQILHKWLEWAPIHISFIRLLPTIKAIVKEIKINSHHWYKFL